MRRCEGLKSVTKSKRTKAGEFQGRAEGVVECEEFSHCHRA